MRVVIDTNILVSALWSRHNNLTRILSLIINDTLLPCFNPEIMEEYKNVLNRSKFAFRFEESRVIEILTKIEADGLCVAVRPSVFRLPDESDRFFYDVAKVCEAYLITGNLKHYPDEPFIMSPVRFLDMLAK